jgi:type I restriction enzyme S subunit
MKIQPATSQWFGEQGVRLDASYHLSEGRIAKIKAERCPFGVGKIGDVSLNIFYGGRSKRNYVNDETHGIPFMGSSDMLKSDFSSLKYLSKKYTKDLGNYLVQKGWTLVSRSGTIGNTIFVNENFLGKAASEHIIRVIPDESKIAAGFLYAYLSSKFGYSLLTQGTFGAVIQHIEPHHIKDLPIPLLPEAEQAAIHAMIEEAAQLRVEANRLLEEAVKEIEKEIGGYQKIETFKCTSIPSEQISVFQNRLDAQYHYFRKDLRSKINFIPFKKLKLFAEDVFVGGRGKRNYTKQGLPFLSSSEILLAAPLSGCKYISPKEKNKADLIVQQGWLLITRSGTVGNVVLAGKTVSGIAVSEHALRVIVKSDEVTPEYIFACLRTSYGKQTLESGAFGSVIITLNEDFINEMEIPILSKDKIEIITQMIKRYVNNFDRANELETAAIRQVEEWIEAW